MVLRPNRVTSSNSSTVSMDSYKQLQPSSNNQEDSFHRKILDKIEEAKRDRDPQKCQQILDDLMKMLKHLTADVNNYNLAFRETRPPFYMQVRSDVLPLFQAKPRVNFILSPIQEFQRLTDSIETLTKARDTITEFLRELEDKQSLEHAASSSHADASAMPQATQNSPKTSQAVRSSPPERAQHPHSSTSSSIQSGTKETFANDHPSATSNSNEYHFASAPTSAHPQHRPRSPSMTPSNFIRVHFPNKHTTAVRCSSNQVRHDFHLVSASSSLPHARMKHLKLHLNRVR